MSSQGSGGAYEISQRMTALVGWGATTKFQEDWVWDQAADTYAMDEEMRERLRCGSARIACIPIIIGAAL